MAVVAQVQFGEWRELKAKELRGSQGGGKYGVLRTDIYRGLEATSAGWGHLGPGWAACGGTVWTGSLVIRSGTFRDER